MMDKVIDNTSNVVFIIKTHELGYVMDFLIDEYYRTWNPWKKKKMREIMNKFHRYMFPDDKKPLFGKGEK